MAFITTAQARAAAAGVRARTGKNYATLLREAAATAGETFDIFLSHSRMDQELVLGAKQLIEDAGLSVYVDWINDEDIERDAVDREHAKLLRNRMEQCESLFYAHTPNASLSRWCPWELGYFDALKKPEQRVFVLPIVEGGTAYRGQEYLSLYEPVDLASFRKPLTRRRDQRPSAVSEQLLRQVLGRPRGPSRDFFDGTAAIATTVARQSPTRTKQPPSLPTGRAH